MGTPKAGPIQCAVVETSAIKNRGFEMSKSKIKSVVWLVGGYIVCQMIADVGATKFVEIAGVVMPAGTFVFAVTFTLRDMLHKRLGKEWARTAIVAAAAFNIFLSGYLWLMTTLPSPVWFGLWQEWDSIFSIVPSIALGSIGAEMISELVDTEVYHLWTTRLPNLPQWTRVLASNFLSIPIDSLVFAALSFVLLPLLLGGQSMTLLGAVQNAVSGQIIYKAVVTIVSLPAIYLVSDQR